MWKNVKRLTGDIFTMTYIYKRNENMLNFCQSNSKRFWLLQWRTSLVITVLTSFSVRMMTPRVLWLTSWGFRTSALLARKETSSSHSRFCPRWKISVKPYLTWQKATNGIKLAYFMMTWEASHYVYRNQFLSNNYFEASDVCRFVCIFIVKAEFPTFVSVWLCSYKLFLLFWWVC